MKSTVKSTVGGSNQVNVKVDDDTHTRIIEYKRNQEYKYKADAVRSLLYYALDNIDTEENIDDDVNYGIDRYGIDNDNEDNISKVSKTKTPIDPIDKVDDISETIEKDNIEKDKTSDINSDDITKDIKNIKILLGVIIVSLGVGAIFLLRLLNQGNL